MGDQAIVIVIVLVVLFIFVLIYSLTRRYKRCPSDHILVVYGKVGGKSSAKSIHGGAAFVWPIFQDYQYLDLTPIPIEVDLKNALSRQNIRVSVPSRFMVGISTEPGLMENAAERLLGLKAEEIQHLSSDIIFGQLRVVIATMDIEEINSDREKFLRNVSESVEHELAKIGLKLINVNVTDITDEAGYIDALGQEATAKALNDAKKAVAEKNRDGAIGEAEAKREERIETSRANSEAVEGENRAMVTIANSDAAKRIGEAEATKHERIETSRANSQAIEGENLAKVAIANSDAERRKSEAEAKRIAVTAEKVNEAEAQKAAYEAQQISETSRAEREKATRYADEIVPTEINKQKKEIDAEAEAERIRRIAKGEADARFAQMEAEAKGLNEILSKQADGFQKLVNASGDNARDAVMIMIANQLPELVRTQVDAIKNLKIDKVTVWDNMSSGKDGKSPSTANFLSGMLGALPPFDELFKMAGMELPNYLKGEQKSTDKTQDAEIISEENETEENDNQGLG